MADKLTQLKALTTVVADTGDIEAIKRYQPIDATTNPSLVLKASEIPEYAPLIEDAINWAKAQSQDNWFRAVSLPKWMPVSPSIPKPASPRPAS